MVANSSSCTLLYHLVIVLLIFLPSSCGGFPNSSSNININTGTGTPPTSQPQHHQQEGSCSAAAAATSTIDDNDSESEDDDDNWLSSSAQRLFEDEATRQRLVETIQAGRVYQHPNFLTSQQIDQLLKEVSDLEASGQLARSGLSNTQKGSEQNFGSSDRFVCPVPWWKDSLLLSSSSSSGKYIDSEESNAAKDNTVAMLLNKLRYFLSDTLHRPTMKDHVASSSSDSSSSSPIIAHECYFSVAHEGSTLARHMDERHEECKGAKGWLLPSRRSLSWLVYLTDKDWTLEQNGGGLRTFPQHRVIRTSISNPQQPSTPSSSHDGNLQIGWLIPVSKDAGTDRVSRPVYLDSWFRPKGAAGMEQQQPHCILNTTVSSCDAITKKADDDNRIFLTQPFMVEALPPGVVVMDFIKAWAEKDSSIGGGGSDISSPDSRQGLFLRPEYAQEFALLEDRQEWDASSSDPRGSRIEDINPAHGSLVVFDSVMLPHQVEAVKKGKRVALAGWFHEETQPLQY